MICTEYRRKDTKLMASALSDDVFLVRQSTSCADLTPPMSPTQKAIQVTSQGGRRYCPILRRSGNLCFRIRPIAHVAMENPRYGHSWCFCLPLYMVDCLDWLIGMSYSRRLVLELSHQMAFPFKTTGGTHILSVGLQKRVLGPYYLHLHLGKSVWKASNGELGICQRRGQCFQKRKKSWTTGHCI